MLALVAAADRTSLGTYLTTLANDLFAAGADLVAVTAVAPHLAIRELQESAAGPVVNLLDCVSKGLTDAGLDRVAILGNRSVIETNIYGAITEELVVKLDPQTIQTVHDTYSDIALSGKRGTQPETDYLANLAHDLMQQQGAQAIVLAGTDLSSFYADQPPSFPFLDVASLHIEQIFRQIRTK